MYVTSAVLNSHCKIVNWESPSLLAYKITVLIIFRVFCGAATKDQLMQKLLSLSSVNFAKVLSGLRIGKTEKL